MANGTCGWTPRYTAVEDSQIRAAMGAAGHDHPKWCPPGTVLSGTEASTSAMPGSAWMSDTQCLLRAGPTLPALIASLTTSEMRRCSAAALICRPSAASRCCDTTMRTLRHCDGSVDQAAPGAG